MDNETKQFKCFKSLVIAGLKAELPRFTLFDLKQMTAYELIQLIGPKDITFTHTKSED